MTYIRQYKLQAREGAADGMAAALEALEAAVLKIEGCVGIDRLRDADGGNVFVFVERWISREAHAAGAKQVPAEVMGGIRETAGAAPEALSLTEA